MQIGRFIRLAIMPFVAIAVCNVAFAEVLNVDDPKLKEIREHIMRAYNEGLPPPIMQCTEERHHAAVKLYTRVVTSREQTEMLAHMQSSLAKGEDNVFIGLPETVAALGSSKIQYMLYWDKLMINSATYRNPLSGKTVTQHTVYSPSIQLAFNYTEPETGCYMELISCYPFVKWISLFYRRYVPQITRLESDTVQNSQRNLFLKLSDGLGGRYSEVLRLADNKWLEDIYRTSAIRLLTTNSKETAYGVEELAATA